LQKKYAGYFSVYLAKFILAQREQN
jgi:hypothetical protein